VIVRPLADDELAFVDARLPLSRLGNEGGQYVVAWLDRQPVGHAHIAWRQTRLGVPEVQDVFVAEAHRRRGIATQLVEVVETLVRERGGDALSLSVGIGNYAAQALWDRLGFVDAGIEPERILGTITLRDEPFEVDDTLVYLVKRLGPSAPEPPL
jgi:ribosomal protein S18 acetylase RimI-like enzyme